MNIYSINEVNKVTVVLHFGLGLIGSGIYSRLKQVLYTGTLSTFSFPISWMNQKLLQSEVTEIIKKSKELMGHTDVESSIIILWSAGKAGFDASREDIEKEVSYFKMLFDVLLNEMREVKVHKYVIFFSSAGGLFENKVGVNNHMKPQAKRPYGELKSMQEIYLRNKKSIHKGLKILRPSSVYSRQYNPNDRMGLMSILMRNAIRGKVTTIFGNENTLRDYVCNEKIAKHVVDLLLSPSSIGLKLVDFLVSGKPTSIFEVKKMIEMIVGKPLFIKYSLDKNNSADITFNPNLNLLKPEPY